LVNWELEKVIWDDLLAGKDILRPVDTKSTTLILTEAPNQLPALSSNTDQVVFEEYEFDAYYKCPASSLVAWNSKTVSVTIQAKRDLLQKRAGVWGCNPQ
jgi:actin-related protein 6